MTQRIAALVVLTVFCSYVTADDADHRTGVDFSKPTALSHAVEQFNAQANRVSEVGRDQPPLTVDEIVAAIRAWDTEEFRIEPELHAVFKWIADRKKLPPGTELSFTTGWGPKGGYRYTVWWVDLSVSAPNPAKEGSRIGYSYRIRDRMLSSRLSPGPVDAPSKELSSAERQRYIANYIGAATFEAGNDGSVLKRQAE